MTILTRDPEELYRTMLLIRCFEEPVLENFSKGYFNGTTHTYLGQEANAAAILAHLSPSDIVVSNHVYVDIDGSQRDVGGYVHEAKAVVDAAQRDGTLTMPAGYFLKWTGQYELLEKMAARMRVVIPLTLMIILLLLYWHFRNFTEVLIVLLSIPFALVGSVWLMWLLDYRLSTAVWVGIIALVGLAAQTGVVMIEYIDNAYERRKKAGTATSPTSSGPTWRGR